MIGLGRMGKNIVLHLLEEGVEVVAWNRSREPREELREDAGQLKIGSQNLKVVNSIDELVESLDEPRIIWLMVTAGGAVDEILNQLTDKLSSNDLVIDGGNSFYKDTLRRAEMLSKKGIHFMDVGTSGGIESARTGACLMVGGSKENYERILPVLKAIAAPDAYGLLGPVGAGHFAKMIHNGIEYGMMESISEGATLLKNSPFDYDLREVFRVYSIKSIIESRLVSWIHAELKNDPELSNISSVIGSAGSAERIKGEGDWSLEFAKEKGIEVPVIETSLKIRDDSKNDSEDSPAGFRNKVIAAMRWQFGRHPVKKTKPYTF